MSRPMQAGLPAVLCGLLVTSIGGSFSSTVAANDRDTPARVPAEPTSSRSVSILDDARGGKRSLAAGVRPSPGIAICTPGTVWDLQQVHLGQKQVATLGGDPTVTNVHFAWTHWDVIPDSLGQLNRMVSYNGYDPQVAGLCLGNCGSTIAGGGHDPAVVRAGYANVDVMSDDNASVFFHQLNPDQGPLPPDNYESWVLETGIPCFDIFIDEALPDSKPGEAIWPHGAIDRGGSTEKDPGDDVFHVTAHPNGESPPFDDEIYYWRRIGPPGNPWQGPVVLDTNSGHLNHYIATDPASDKVAVIYTRDYIPGNPDSVLQVVYMESSTNGADWIAANTFPTPLTSLGFNYTQVTNYTADGPQAWVEAGGEYDYEGALHVFWVERVYGDSANDCRIKHWSALTGFSTIAEAIGWSNQGETGEWDLWLASPGIAFGDGRTECPDGPLNQYGQHFRSNRNYIYCFFAQYGGPTVAEQNDVSAGGYHNQEIYCAGSRDRGATWSAPENVTNTQTPGCDGTAGNECASERDPSIALVVNDVIHLEYLLDTEAGDAVFGHGNWTFNPVMYYRIPARQDSVCVCGSGGDTNCDCPNQGDFDEDGFVTSLDLAALIDILFAGDPDIEDPNCPVPRGDLDCDGFTTSLDLAVMIDFLFAGGAAPCEPCVVCPDGCP